MEVDYPRVTPPFAGVLTLAGFLPRLACVRHAASVRSEPGSNSPIINRSVFPVAAAKGGLATVALFLHRAPRLNGTRSVHSKHCEVPQSFFVDLLSSFQRPTRPALPAPPFQRPRPP